MSTEKKQWASPIYGENKLTGTKWRGKRKQIIWEIKLKKLGKKQCILCKFENLLLHPILFSQRPKYKKGSSTDQLVLECVIQINE